VTETISADSQLLRATRLVWPLAIWPEYDRSIWIEAQLGTGPGSGDNPAVNWSKRTVKNREVGYGQYLSWLHRAGILVESETIAARISPERLAGFTGDLKSRLASVSVGMTVASLAAAARALAPDVDWSWLSRRATRLKLNSKPSRDKRHAMQHTLDLYKFGKQLMDTAGAANGKNVLTVQRYQAGLIVALLAARPLRIRNFQAISIGTSLRWEGRRYWLTFSAEDTKTGAAIDEPLPDDLIPYLEAFLQSWRPVLVRRASKVNGDPAHRRLWVDRYGAPMRENTLRSMIERYTKNRFGTAIWPHLFRDCLLTSLAVDQPDLMSISATLLGHAKSDTGNKHYNQARMLDASRRYGKVISEMREALLAPPRSGDDDG
jgi:integrase/recombinase XerD